MQTRTGFNAGELAPEMATRCDVDAYMRGCRVLENWNVGQMGGVKRRRGMRYFADAFGSASRLFPYVYSYAAEDNLRFLVELGGSEVRVYNEGGERVATFVSGENDCTEFLLPPKETRAQQINSVLIFTNQAMHPMALRYDGDSTWTFERWKISLPPWRYENERRDNPIIVTRKAGTAGEVINVTFSEDEEEDESEVSETDTLRASYWTEQQEAYEKGAAIRDKIKVVNDVHAAIGAQKGDSFAVHTDDTVRYYICTQEFPGDVYVDGLDEPTSYPDNFVEAENIDGFENVAPVYSVHEVNNGGTIVKNTKIAIKSGYWELFTCVKSFTESDYEAQLTSFTDYDGFFVRGVPVGDALPCRGRWEFYCSGLWYGEYEVRRNFNSSLVSSPDWESAGNSFSRISEATNTSFSGDEADEECYLRLWLTRTKHMGSDIASGFPPDSCGNRLIVEGYRHDMMLRAYYMDDGSVEWECIDNIPIDWTGRKVVYNWSWQAFSDRYGYPAICCVFDQRLVFASTEAQYQTIWFSRVDELDNFALSDSDSGGIALTISSTTQNPINWMRRQRHNLLIGTSDAEYVLTSSSTAAAITATNVRIEQHGYIGSTEQCLETDQVLLYVERGGGRCYEFAYVIDVDGYRSKDLTVLAPHALANHGGAWQAALSTKPDTVALFVLGDGQVALCTYNSMQQVNAWHRWTTDGIVHSVAVLPNGNDPDRFFFVIEREHGTFIEVVDEDSEYIDNGGNDYVSTVVTNGLSNPLEQTIEKRPKSPVAVRFGCDVPTDSIEICADGGKWTRPARTDAVITEGWHQLLVYNTWAYENAIGIRCRGNQPCIIYALQG